MSLFLGGLCLGVAIGVIVMEVMYSRDDIGRGHPL